LNQRIGIMQPYFFPYVGYFQLINEVDVFVLYDDVNFFKRGWMNRNNILVNQAPHLLTIPCKKVSQNKFINEVEVNLDQKTTDKLLTKFKMAYRKAPYFDDVYPLIEDVLRAGDKTIAELSGRSIKSVVEYLELPVILKESFKHYNNRQFKKADRLIDICHREGISEYVNMVGGRELYTKNYFKERGIDLYFLIPEAVPYRQFSDHFVPWLSILDVLMFNDKKTTKEKLLSASGLE